MTDPSGPQFVISGGRDGTSPSYAQGTYGLYWSSSAWTSTTRAYDLALISINSRVIPADNGSKRDGFSLRCLAQKTRLRIGQEHQNILVKHNH